MKLFKYIFLSLLLLVGQVSYSQNNLISNGSNLIKVGNNLLSVPFSPSYIPGLKLWLRADKGIVKDATESISAWIDQSGNGLNAVQSTGLDQPTFVDGELNGKPVIRFDGTDHFMTAGVAADWTFMNDGSPFTIFKVVRITDANPNDFQYFLSTHPLTVTSIGFVLAYDDRAGSGKNNTIRCAITNGSANVVFANSADDKFTTQTYHIAGVTYKRGIAGDDLNVYVDGVLAVGADEASAPAAGDPVGALQIGRDISDVGLLKGDIAEIIIYSLLLNSQNIDLIRNYLNNKYLP